MVTLSHNGITLSGAWSVREIEFLNKHYPNTDTREVAGEFWRSMASVRAKAAALGLRRAKAHGKSAHQA